jgi:hypothetical protein
MADTGAVLLREVLDTYKEFFDIILAEDVYIVCVNRRDKKTRSMPFKVLYGTGKQFWTKDAGWDYFLTEETLSAIKKKAASLKAALLAQENSQQTRENTQSSGRTETGFGEQFGIFAAMTDEQRVRCIDEAGERLDKLLAGKSVDTAVAVEALVDSTRDTALINHIALADALRLSDADAKQHTQALVDSTSNLVKSSSLLVSMAFDDKLMNTLVEKSNGTIIRHITRVYLLAVAFLAYYNDIVSSGYINKIRSSFEEKYRSFYLLLLPHMAPYIFSLERVFRGGMRTIPPNWLSAWAVGFMMHDVGKAAAVEYHEGEEAYNRDIVVEHVKLGYDSVMHKTNYPKEAGLITGYHHEYYGDSSGYGYFRSYLERYKKANPRAQVEHCIAYELEPVLYCHALGYFPAKVLEIIDVYDSVTDPNRKYRKALSPEEALVMMRKEFIEKSLKIDIILFDLFSSYVREKIMR